MKEIRFSAITYSHKLQEAGLDQKIADVQAEEMSVLINNDLVTKSFLSSELINLEYRLTIKLGLMMMAMSVIIISILGFILKH